MKHFANLIPVLATGFDDGYTNAKGSADFIGNEKEVNAKKSLSLHQTWIAYKEK